VLHRNDKAHECRVGKGKVGAERPLSLSPKPINHDFVISTDPPAKAKRRAGGRNLVEKTFKKNQTTGQKDVFFDKS